MTGRADSTMNSGRSLSGLTIAACSVALLAPLLAPLLTGRVFVYNDLSSFHLPMRYLYQQALQTGDTVLWTPSIFAGLYLQGEGQVGLFHPFHQLLYRFLSLGTAFNLELIANYPAAFAGMFWFLRRLRISKAAALFGAMLFAFSGFNLLHHHHLNMVAVVAHMPWLLAAADVLIVDERRHARTLAFAAVAVVLDELPVPLAGGVWPLDWKIRHGRLSDQRWRVGDAGRSYHRDQAEFTGDLTAGPVNNAVPGPDQRWVARVEARVRFGPDAQQTILVVTK